mmetsp:Transcript_2811/g.7293  ORF Transcript_2811/g.7293 Transcript_2811/m.7293 type:complete len:297 (-) Transcript_2811:212-1102(-)
MVHANAAAQAVHQVGWQRLPGLQAGQRLLDVLGPLAEGLRAVKGELHVDLVHEVDGWRRRGHVRVHRDVDGLDVARATALVVASSLSCRSTLLVLAGQHLLRLFVGRELVLVVGEALLHDPLRLIVRLLGTIVLVVLLVLELVHKRLHHPLDVLAGEVEDDGRQVLQLIQRTDQGHQGGGLQVRVALWHLGEVKGRVGALLLLGVVAILHARGRLELDGLGIRLDVDDGARHLLQRKLELVEDLRVDGAVLHQVQEGALQFLLPHAGVRLPDEATLLGEVALRRQHIPRLTLANNL